MALPTCLAGGLVPLVLESGVDLNNVFAPNTYIGANLSSNSYGNCPITAGTFILQVFQAGEGEQYCQRLSSCAKVNPQTFERFYYGGTWGAWGILGGMADYIVAQGTSGIWTYRKWNSGIAECWTTSSISIKNCPIGSALMGGYYAQTNSPGLDNFPITFIQDPIAFGMSLLGNGTGYTGIGANTTRITYVSSTGNANSKDINSLRIQVIGRWK